MKEPVTECGLNAKSVKTLTRQEFFKRIKDYGQQRTGLVTCMTCMATARRWPTWNEDPRLALSREIDWEGPYWRVDGNVQDRNGHQLRDELLAIGDLISAHTEQFQQLLATIDARHRWLERKLKKES
jgi:hypothetical protein